MDWALQTERREDVREGVMWRTDILPQWLSGPVTMSTWPVMLGSVCSFQKGTICAAEKLSQKLEVP